MAAAENDKTKSESLTPLFVCMFFPFGHLQPALFAVTA